MEPIVAGCLAAAAGACVVTGIGLALPRSRKPAKGLPVDARSVWGAVAMIAGVIAPGPKIVTVPVRPVTCSGACSSSRRPWLPPVRPENFRSSDGIATAKAKVASAR